MENNYFDFMANVAKEFGFYTPQKFEELDQSKIVYPLEVFSLSIKEDEHDRAELEHCFSEKGWDAINICNNKNEMDNIISIYKKLTDNNTSIHLFIDINSKEAKPKFDSYEFKKMGTACAIRNLMMPWKNEYKKFSHWSEVYEEKINSIKKMELSKEDQDSDLAVFCLNLKSEVKQMFLALIKDPSMFSESDFMLGDGFAMPREITSIKRVKGKNDAEISSFELAIYCNKCILNKWILPSNRSENLDKNFILFLLDYIDFVLEKNFENLDMFTLATPKEFELMNQGYYFIHFMDEAYFEEVFEDTDAQFYLIEYDEEEGEIKNIQHAMRGYGVGDAQEANDFLFNYQKLVPNNNIKLAAKI